MSRRKVCWSELPPELLTLIADRLETRTDVCRFRSVCKQWRESTLFSVNPPENLLSPNFPCELLISDSSSSTPLVHSVIPMNMMLVQKSVFVVRSSAGDARWLCAVEELNSGKLCLHRLFYGARVNNVGQYLPKSNLNLSYSQVKEVGRFYAIRSFKSSDNYKFERMKVVLISDPNCKRLLSRIDDYKAMVLCEDENLWLIGNNGRSVKVAGPNMRKYDDIINFKGSIYVIDRKGRLYTRSYNSTKLSIVVSRPVGEGSGSDGRKRIFESCDRDLYLIHRCAPYMKVFFKLYKWKEDTNNWDDVDGIGLDRILLMSRDGCFFVHTKELPGWRGNCIVFANYHFSAYDRTTIRLDRKIFGTTHHGEESVMDLAVLNFEDGTCKRLDSYPGCYDAFWPPPAWLSRDTCYFKGLSISVHDHLAALKRSSGVNKSIAASMVALKDKDKDNQQGIILNEKRNEKAPIINSSPKMTSKAAENVVSQSKFQGVTVCSTSVPILEKIWDKYGNVIQEHVVHSRSLLTWALDSLAKMVLIIDTKTYESLSNSEAEFLSETLKDLQYLHLRLDWLAPVVEKASAQKNEIKAC